MPTAPREQADTIWLRAPDIRQRYRVSDMWIDRRLKDDSGFPKPSRFGRHRFWRLADLEAWEQSREAQPDA